MFAKSSAKVGAVVLLAIALGIVLYSQLAHIKANSYSVKLNVEDTQGLSTQSVVRMQGVAVGEVASVDLDQNSKPLIYLSIKRKYRIPKNYMFKITSGILITQAQVQIVPPKPPNGTRTEPLQVAAVGDLPTDGTAVVKGEKPPVGLIASVDPELEQTFVKLNETFTIITDKFNQAYGQIDVVLKQTRSLMTTANSIANSTNNVISDPSLKQNLIASLGNVRKATEDAHLMTSQLRLDLDDLVGSSKGSLKDMGTKVNALLGDVDKTVADTDTVVKKLTEQVTDPHLQQSLQETTELARSTLARFNQILTNLHNLTGDPLLQENIKQTVANMTAASESGKNALGKMDQILGKFTNTRTSAPKIPRIQVVANESEAFSPGRNRLDLDAIVPLGGHGLFDLGLYDIGQNTRLTLQAGNHVNDNLAFRYGIFASKIGVGLDYTAAPGTGIRADLFNTGKVELDLRGFYRVNKSASLWIGGLDVTRDPRPIIGVQLTN